MVPSSYSSQVELTLIVGDTTLALSHVGNCDFVIRDHCEPLPPCDAVLRISVDGCVRVHKIHLPQGISGPREPIPYT